MSRMTGSRSFGRGQAGASAELGGGGRSAGCPLLDELPPDGAAEAEGCGATPVALEVGCGLGVGVGCASLFAYFLNGLSCAARYSHSSFAATAKSRARVALAPPS